MSKDWRTICGFALLGLAFAVVTAGYEATSSSSNSNVAVDGFLFVLCPAALLLSPLFASFFEAAEVGTPGFYILWSLAGLANAAIYALIGAAYVGLRKKPDGAVTR
jgi:hypothetical protein